MLAAGELEQVGRVAAAAALDVEGVEVRPPNDRERVLDREHLVEAVGVDRELDVVAVGDVERGADLRGPGADVLVDLQPGAAGAQAVLDRARAAPRTRARAGGVERLGLERGPGRRRPAAGLLPRFQTGP